MNSLEKVRRSKTGTVSTCRFEVEVAMKQMLNCLQARGWSQAELALALADAAEDHVILIASKVRKVN